MSEAPVKFEALRSLANGSISGTYAAVGTAFLHPIQIICITNNTDGDMIFSFDGGVHDHLFIAKGSFKLFDLCTNKTGLSTQFSIPQGTIVYVKQSTAPTTGSVYMECIY
jgi:hypothetical protein